MKRLIAFGIWMAVCVSVGAQTPVREWPVELNGSMMLYDFSTCARNADAAANQGGGPVPWGEDMEPVYIAYVARHGARFLSSEKKVEALCRELSRGDSAGYLSAKGKDFLKLLNLVDLVTAGRWGALSPVGMEEEQRLAREMTAAAPRLLKEGKLMARATYVPRVVMTMYEFTHGLARYSSGLEITTQEGRQFNPILRFFDADSTYMAYLDSGPWKEIYNAFVDTTVSAAPAQGLFTKPMDLKKMRRLTMDMYGVLQSLPAAGLPWEPWHWMDEDDYRRCWEAANLKHYLQRSVNPCSDIAARAAEPLYAAIHESIEKATRGTEDMPRVEMWFGHAETVMPLFALMRLPGCYAPDCEPGEVAAKWRDWEVSPLGANLMIVLLRSREGDHRIAMRLNGKWL